MAFDFGNWLYKLVYEIDSAWGLVLGLQVFASCSALLVTHAALKHMPQMDESRSGLYIHT